MNDSEADDTATLAAVQAGVTWAQDNPEPGEPLPSDEYVARCVIRELRRAGLKIVHTQNSD